MFEEHPSLRRWLRHTASVPKGFLRHYVLELLRETPMSGSEIMDEIEKQTNGRWKPSPGSVYPLLAWLQDNEYTKEVPVKESGIKRYMLTKKGEELFKEQSKLKEKLQDRLGFFAHPFLGWFWFSPYAEKLSEIREPARRFVRALFDLRTTLHKNMSDDALKEVAELLNSTAEKIEEISKQLKDAGSRG